MSDDALTCPECHSHDVRRVRTDTEARIECADCGFKIVAATMTGAEMVWRELSKGE